MLEELKKKSFKKSLVGTVILFVICIGLAAVAVYNLFLGEDFSALAPKLIDSQKVKVDLEYNMGCFIEEYQENTSTHKQKTTSLYYVITTCNELVNDNSYMGIKVPVKYEDKMEAMAESTIDYGEPYGPVHFVGKIKKMTAEDQRYFKSYFTESGVSAAQFEEWTIPYYIDVIDPIPYYMCLGAAGLFLLWAIVRIIRGSSGAYIKKFVDAINKAGYSEATISSDMASAAEFCKGDIKLGRLCMYHGLNSSVPRAIPVAKILWAYQVTTTHRTNGIKTNTTYSIMIFDEDTKNGTTIPISKEPEVKNILAKMDEMYPWVVVGHTDAIRKLFHKDREQFLQLKYNTVEHVTVEPGFEGFSGTYDTSYDAAYDAPNQETETDSGEES